MAGTSSPATSQPRQHNRPGSIEAPIKLNDVELFDLQTDPLELNTLALDRKKHGGLLEARSAKLNALIDEDIPGRAGRGAGRARRNDQELPGGMTPGRLRAPPVADPWPRSAVDGHEALVDGGELLTEELDELLILARAHAAPSTRRSTIGQVSLLRDRRRLLSTE